MVIVGSKMMERDIGRVGIFRRHLENLKKKMGVGDEVDRRKSDGGELESKMTP